MPSNQPSASLAAETRLRADLLRNPNDARTWLELGDLLAANWRFAEADAAYKSCLAADASVPRAYVQLGKLSLLRNQIAEAIDLLKQADTACRGTASASNVQIEALELLVQLMLRDGKVMAALPYLQHAVELGAGEATRTLFANCLARLRFTGPRPDLKPIFVQLLTQLVVPPADLVRAAISLLLAEYAIEDISAVADYSPLLSGAAPRRIASDVLLQAVLTSAIVVDDRLEQLLKSLRRALVLSLAAEKSSSALEGTWLAFSSALAAQCFVNDYAMAWDEEEHRCADRLADRVVSDLDGQQSPQAIEIAVLACYRPLVGVPHCEALLGAPWPDSLGAVLKLQIRAPKREMQLRETIPVLTEFGGPTTLAVRHRYEESPYPRWFNVPRRATANRFQDMLQAALPPALAERQNVPDPKNILIAGCGTGQESTAFGLQFPQADIMAVDLSMASLAYAARNAEEYGIANVRYAQADLLRLAAIGPFDLTVCAGVLHHLDEPAEGLRALSKFTNPGGHLMIAVYSRLGRQSLDAVTAFAKSNGYGDSFASLRQLRADILALDAENPLRLSALAWDDFYSLNMIRDMIFHPCEHRLTIPEIAHWLATLKLEFRGFLVTPESRRMFLARFDVGADLLSLTQWDRLENENPNLFSSMYHFIVRKPD